mgnify:CR=1 FL=1
MFKAELEDIKPFKDSLQAISNLITEGQFQIDEEGLKLKAADPAMVSLVDFKLLKDSFSSFEIDEKTQIGLNLEKMYSILRRAKSSDKLEFSLSDESKFVMKITNGSTRTFSLPVLNIDEEAPETSQLDFNVTADFKSSTISRGIGDVAIIGESVTIEADSDSITLKAEGDNTDAEFNIEKGSDGLMDIESDGKAKSMFSMDYLKKMIKAEKLSDTVKMSLGNDFPMRLDFEIPDKLKLGFILAPRIEE